MVLSVSGAAIADDSASAKSQRGQAYTGDPVQTSPAQPGSDREMKNVSYSFPINDISQIDFSPKPSHIQSRQFKLDVTGAQLKSGVSLNTSAKGALVRISAFDGESAIEPKSLKLISPKGQALAQSKAFDSLVDSHAMQKNGMGFQRGTTGFKLADSLGSGRFTLKAEQGVNSRAKYRINVFEKNSDTEMHLTANKSNYLKSQTLTVKANVFAQGAAQNIVDIKGQLVSPSGQRFDVDFKSSKEGYLLNKPLNMSAQSTPGALWELHTETQVKVNGNVVQRNGQLPFAFADKTAKLSASATVAGEKSSPVATVPVSATKDGRYEVRAVLYGTDSRGQLKPVMLTHSAANLAAGESAIYMKFDPQIIKRSGLTAPYEVRQLELRDQEQMALIDR